MPFVVPIEDARRDFPQYTFVDTLTPSEQKAAFHVRNADGDEFCLKIIAPDYNIDRLNREIRALHTVRHPNVGRLVEYRYSSKPDGIQHYLVEEFVSGSDLTVELESAPWEVERAAAFFAALADGLDALRQTEVVHRDLKPSNIRVRPDGSPVIIDFGLARHLTLPDLTITAFGAQIGTPLYFAPEQFRGTKRDIDHRTDLFSLGIIIHQAVIGPHPFYTQSMSDAELESAVCDDGFQPGTDFAELPDPWKLLISRLLATERNKRLSSAAQAATIIRRV